MKDPAQKSKWKEFVIIMAEKKTGISRDLIIHPGETIADVIAERGITQAELAVRTGVTPAYVSNVLAGKKDISARFAFALEYALNVPKTFWLNLQTHYESELMDYYEQKTITDEERAARESLKEIVRHLRQKNYLPTGESIDKSILSLRKVLRISNLANLKDVAPSGLFKMADKYVDPIVLGAWILLCQSLESDNSLEVDGCSEQDSSKIAAFEMDKVTDLIYDLKTIMLNDPTDIKSDLKRTMASYGIDFLMVRRFRGAPVQGFISRKTDGTYRMVLTVNKSFAGDFWFSLFHELGHIVNEDIGKAFSYIDGGTDEKRELAADLFARKKLMIPDDYQAFVDQKDYHIESIIKFAESQRVIPSIVIEQLQKEKEIDSDLYSSLKMRYNWD